LIELALLGGNDDPAAVHEIVNKGELLKKECEKRNINKDFVFKTQIFSLPQGDQKHVDQMEENGDKYSAVGDMMASKLLDFANILGDQQISSILKEKIIVESGKK
jgi:hypothetical protein